MAILSDEKVASLTRRLVDTVIDYKKEAERLAMENENLRAALEGVTEIAESYLNMMPDRHGIHGPKIEAARAALTEPTKENTHD